MHFAVGLGIFCLTIIAPLTKGCHTSLHIQGNRPAVQPGSFPTGGGNIQPDDEIRLLLSNHGLDSSIIDCVINLQSTNKRKRRSPFGGLQRIPIKNLELEPNSETALRAECSGKNEQLCRNVQICAQRDGKDIPQLHFLDPTPATTTTTSTNHPIIVGIPIPTVCGFFGLCRETYKK